MDLSTAAGTEEQELQVQGDLIVGRIYTDVEREDGVDGGAEIGGEERRRQRRKEQDELELLSPALILICNGFICV